MSSKLEKQKTTRVVKTKEIRKIPPDYCKINKTRRSRGYNFEYDIVQAFNNHPSKEWSARRLGGSSTGLPDIVVTNNRKSILYAIECKSGESSILYIPKDQIERCKEIVDKVLRIYKERWIVFAFKFKSKKGTYLNRKLQYRILPCDLFHCYDIKDMKGISYDLNKEQLTFHYDKEIDNVIFSMYGGLESALKSLDEFVNWR